MKKERLRVVWVITKTIFTDGREILIRVHESAYNLASTVTLLSEYQVRSHGCIINSVTKNHRIGFGNSADDFGTQSIMLHPNMKIALKNRSALMTFDLLPPSDDDMESLPIIDITSDAVWTPKDHNNDDHLITASTVLSLDHLIHHYRLWTSLVMCPT
jgi:hypothetical protein